MKEDPNAKTIGIHFPDNQCSAIEVAMNSEMGTYWETDYRYYDQYSLREIPVAHLYGRYNEQMSKADKLMRMNYDIHTGQIFGLAGKVFAFLMSLIIASLPVTGFLIWYGKKRKSGKGAYPLEIEASDEVRDV